MPDTSRDVAADEIQILGADSDKACPEKIRILFLHTAFLRAAHHFDIRFDFPAGAGQAKFHRNDFPFGNHLSDIKRNPAPADIASFPSYEFFAFLPLETQRENKLQPVTNPLGLFHYHIPLMYRRYTL